MKLKVLQPREWTALRGRLGALLPEAEATEAFWGKIEIGQAVLRRHLARFGAERVEWELPGHRQRCRVLYVYLYAEALYTPELLPGLVMALPLDDELRWGLELECYSDARRLPNGNPLCLGWAAIAEGALQISSDYRELIAAAAAKLGVERV